MPRKRSTVAALFAALLAVAAAPAAAVSLHVDFDDEKLDLDGELVVITGEDGSEARISPDGELTIRGRRVATSERDQRALRRYNQSVHWIEERAIEIGVQGVGLAVTALGEAVAAIATGDGEHVERRVEERAAPLQQTARALCREVETLTALQEVLAARLPEFRPYAVLDWDDADRCRVDD